MYKNIKPGDEIYVKEAWQTRENLDHLKPSELPTDCEILYRAGDIPIPLPRKWRFGMFMPEWAARIRRTVVATRVEKLQEIITEDIKPCPFCGAEAQFENCWSGYSCDNLIYITCSNIECRVGPSTDAYKTKRTVVKYWNRRVSQRLTEWR